jgi:hypothetical protein
VSALPKLRAQLAVVVDLAVQDDVQAAVLVGDRLVAALDVDDRQAPAAETGRTPDVEALVVGTAVRDRRGHRAQLLEPCPPTADLTADAAQGGLRCYLPPPAGR